MKSYGAKGQVVVGKWSACRLAMQSVSFVAEGGLGMALGKKPMVSANSLMERAVHGKRIRKKDLGMKKACGLTAARRGVCRSTLGAVWS